jgi:preprotein translocase subunit SecE
MLYNIWRTVFLSLLLLPFYTFQANAQGPDSVYTVPNTPFLTQILGFKQLNGSINLSEQTKQIPLQGTMIAGNAQELLKQGDDLYVFIEQTGFVYKLVQYDSAKCVYKRLDRTVNLNYNIDCKNFIYQNSLYSYGGYGFWKTNGTLRKFNLQDKEWDIIPLNQEVIATSFLWFSPAEGRLYVPFQRIVNAGLSGPENIKGVPNYVSYYLDLKNQKWVKMGTLENDMIDLVKNDFASGEFLSYKNGYLHRVNEDTYLFDLIHNKIYKCKNANLNQFLIRRASTENMFIDGDKIYSYNYETKSFISFPLVLSDFELLRTNIWGNESQLYNIFLIAIVIVIILVFSIWLFNKLVKRKLEFAQLNILKNKTVNQAFSQVEVALINLLLTANLKQEYVEINKINQVLGIKDKNLGLQKKVRSDVMKSINEKYEFITSANIPLIGSARKEDDKRFFEYFITPSELKSIKRILENN